MIVSIEVPVQTAIERCHKRKSGIPHIYDGATKEEVNKKFTHLNKLQKYAISHQAKAGVTVITVDGTASVEDCCREIFDAFMAL